MRYGKEKLGTKRDRTKVQDIILSDAKYFKNRNNRRDFDARYNWLNSPLDTQEDATEVPMFLAFKDVLPQPEERADISMRRYIEFALKEKTGNANGIEFGGVGARMFNDFSPDFFNKTAGITLVDDRDDYEQSMTQKHHRVFEHDMFDAAVYDELVEYFDGNGADFIIERLGKGTEFTTKDPYRIAELISKWYLMLNNGGVMFLQVPVTFRHLLPLWSTVLKDAGIEIQYSDGGATEDRRSIGLPVIRIRKVNGSPKDLPLLTPREVHSAYKKEKRL